jgi:PadR family transcriptional regulator PadR
MNTDNIGVQMRKGILEFCVLHIINRGEVYASDLLEELTIAQMVVVEGTLYPLLTRLKNTELVTYRWEESNSGPPRKYFVITEKGKTFLHSLDTAWEEMVVSVEAIRKKQIVFQLPPSSGSDITQE